MPIALRHSITLLYLNALQQWVRDSHDAYDFVDTTSAETFCLQRGLQQVEVLLILRDGSTLVVRLAEK